MKRERRVVVTGMGVLAPKAIGSEAFWQLISEGKSGIGPISIYPMEKFRLNSGGEITDFDPRTMVPNRKALKVMARDIQLVVSAAKLCLDDSKIRENGISSTRLGVSMGAGLINTSIQELRAAVKGAINDKGEFDIRKYGAEGMRSLTPLWLLKYLPNMLSCHISIEYDAQGPSNSLTTGCAASSQAIGEAFRIIERGDADAMIAGGGESKLDPLSWSRFEMLGLLTKNGSPPEKCIRPFDAKREGVLMGEAAGVVILEELTRAKKRGAKIYGELIGFGSTANPSPLIKKIETRAQELSMKNVLADGGCAAEEVDMINAHGLGLPETDCLETQAIKKVFGSHAYKMPVTSYKASTGFIGSAAGALGLIASLLAMEKEWVPPTGNYENKDPECDLDYVPRKGRAGVVETVMINSFGLGGQNASLLIRKFRD